MRYLTVDPKSSKDSGSFTVKNEQSVFNFTLEFLMKSKFDETASTEKPLFEMHQFDSNASLTNTIFKIYVDKSSLNYTFNLSGKTKTIANYKIDNQWNHIAIVFDLQTSCAIYLNGNIILAKNLIDIPNSRTQPLTDFKFYSYKNKSYVYYYNINLTKAIRYNTTFDVNTILKDSVHGLNEGLDDSTTTDIFSPNVTMTDEDQDNIIYLPFKDNTIVDVANNYTPTITNIDKFVMQNFTEDDYYELYDNKYDLKSGLGTSLASNAINYKITGIDELDEWTFECFYKSNAVSKTSGIINTANMFKLSGSIVAKGSDSTSDSTKVSNIAILRRADAIWHHEAISFNKTENRYVHHVDGKILTSVDNVTADNLQYTVSANYSTLDFTMANVGDKAAHLRFYNKCLYPQHPFDPTPFLFEQTIDPDLNGSDKKLTTNETNIALMYPATTNPTSIYQRAYTKDIDFNKTANFQVENGSTKELEWDTNHKTSTKYAGKSFLNYPAIKSTSNTDFRNLIRFRNYITEEKDYTVEFYVYLESDIGTSEMMDIFYASGLTHTTIGLAVNGKGNGELKYSNNSYSVNVLKQPDMDTYILTRAFNINDWNYIAITFIKDQTYVYINGKRYNANYNYQGSKYLHRLFFYTHTKDYPVKFLYTGIKVTTLDKTAEITG